jgi:hypothetical protein
MNSLYMKYITTLPQLRTFGASTKYGVSDPTKTPDMAVEFHRNALSVENQPN